MALTYKEVSEILKIVDSSNCEEVILEVEGMRLVVKRGSSLSENSDLGTHTSVSPINVPNTNSNDSNKKSNQITSQVESTTEDQEETVIRSPMVGTFYQSPSPEDPPFVEKGSRIEKGDPLCLIEVMKLYTTVEATTSGTIESTLIEDGTLVEFNQPLFMINPD